MKTNEGLWKLTPSGLYTYEECPACFWIEQHIGRPPSLPLRLNDAMDEKLKKRYDVFRQQGNLPPEISSLRLRGIKLFDNLEKLNQWRTNKTALSYTNKKIGYLLEGKLDEVFINDRGELMPADFKASGDEPGIDKQKYYRLQLHAYALMLKKRGYKVGKKAYLLHYFTKDRNDTSLAMEFKSHIDEVEIDLIAFEKILKKMVELLNSNFPGADKICKKCLWAEKRKSY